jgi:hypothetical protein
MGEAIKEIVGNQWSILAWLVTVIISLFALKYSIAAKDVAKQANQISDDANQLNINSLLLARYNNVIMRQIQHFSELADDKVFLMALRDDAKSLVDQQFRLDARFEKLLDSIAASSIKNIDDLIESKIVRLNETFEEKSNWEENIDKFDNAITALAVRLTEMNIMKRYSPAILRQFDMESLETEADEIDFLRESVKGISKSLRTLVEKGVEKAAKYEAVIVREEQLLTEKLAQQKEQQGFEKARNIMSKRR